MSGKWSRKQRARFNATIKARGPRKKGSKKKPYRKPGRINVARSGNREVLIRIELV
jgi:hypothetical protein